MYTMLETLNARGARRPMLWIGWGLLCAALVYFLWRTFLPSLGTMTHSYPAYYTASRLVLEGRWTAQIYNNDWFGARVLEMTGGLVSDRFSLHPPTTSLLLVPIAWLDLMTARVVWQMFNLVCLLGALWLVLDAVQVRDPLWRVLFLTGALVYPPSAENLRVGQAYDLVLVLFAISFWGELRAGAARAGGTVLGGVALGLAAGLKLGGAPVGLVLLARGRWRTLVTAGMVILFTALLGLAVLGSAGWLAFFQRLLDSAQPPALAAHPTFQTSPSLFQRLFVPSPDFNPTPLFNIPWLAPVLTILVAGGALGVTLWFARSADLEIALAAAVTLSVILFPMATEYHYTLLLIPLATMGARVMARGDRADRLWLAAVLLLLWMYFDWRPAYWNERALTLFAYPRLYGGWLLWLWLFKQMLRPTAARIGLPVGATG